MNRIRLGPDDHSGVLISAGGTWRFDWPARMWGAIDIRRAGASGTQLLQTVKFQYAKYAGTRHMGGSFTKNEKGYLKTIRCDPTCKQYTFFTNNEQAAHFMGIIT